jgi:hypothetical protein
MVSQRDKENPATPGLFHTVMDERWDLVNSLLGGTEAMRLAGTLYLPQHSREYDEDYRERLKRSILINYFDLTVATLSGKPFTEALQFGDDVPEQIRGVLVKDESEKSESAEKDVLLTGGWIEDIDLEGNHIDQFAARVFRDGVSKGYTHILVDTPAKDPSRTYTLADEKAEGIRPYFVHIHPENVIAANCVRQDGVELLTHIRWYESTTKRDGFAEVEELVIREMTLKTNAEGKRYVETGMYRKLEGKTGASAKSWQKVDAKPTDLDYIPIFTFYARRDGFMVSKPPLLDLAHMNVLHYQRYSDHMNALTVASFPILAASGVAPEDAGSVTIGPRNVLTLEDPNSKYYYVEHQGLALTSSKENLADLENQMGLYGASLLRKRPDRETATSRSIEEKNTSSDLQRMAFGFKDTLENCFKAMAQMGGVGTEGGTIMIHTDFAFEGGDVVDLQTLQVAYDKRAISRVGFINELKRRGILAEDFHSDEDLAHLVKEKQEQMGAFYNPKMAEIGEQTKGQLAVADKTKETQLELADKNAEVAKEVAKNGPVKAGIKKKE